MAPTQALIERLDEFDLAGYIAAVRADGRERLPVAYREFAATTYPRVALSARRVTVGDEAMILSLAERVLGAEWQLAQNGGKRYFSYANLGVLDWLLSLPMATEPAGHTYELRCWERFAQIVHSWLLYEQRTIEGRETWNQQYVPHEHMEVRVALLAEAVDALPSNGLARITPPAPTSWADAALDPSGRTTVEYLLALPQTTEHDELTFLHTVHASECCFSGILSALGDGRAHLVSERWGQAAAAFDRATAFAAALDRVLVVMKTMPPEAFLRFGPRTGVSSGIQSRTYQRLQDELYPRAPERDAILATIPEIAAPGTRQDPARPSLSVLLAGLPVSTETASVRTAARDLDRLLYRWRARHVGVSGQYLTEMVLGAEEGRRYLEEHYRQRL